jgi:hypothetical protein
VIVISNHCALGTVIARTAVGIETRYRFAMLQDIAGPSREPNLNSDQQVANPGCPLSTQRGREMEAALVFIAFWSAPNGHGCRLQRECADESEGESKHWSLRYGERTHRKTWMPQEAHHLPVI